jgi:hypothetical protein
MSDVTTGVGLAKNAFQVHGFDATGEVVFRRQLRRGQLLTARQASTSEVRDLRGETGAGLSTTAFLDLPDGSGAS